MNTINLRQNISEILLLDRTTGKNILWGTDDYTGHKAKDQILLEHVTSNMIQPRSVKAQHQQLARTRDKAEVFTPAWLCNKQNNLIDAEWFGRSDIFNAPDPEDETRWIPTSGKIIFPIDCADRTWQSYVNEKHLEIACGEAPYLVSRYDSVTGEEIPVEGRIGLLDRKLRIVGENTSALKDWYTWALNAYKSIYAYEYQGDSLFLARVNLIETFNDYYHVHFDDDQQLAEMQREIAAIISWNVWQMDGLKFVVPGSCRHNIIEEDDLTLFDNRRTVVTCPGCESGNIKRHNGIHCKIRDWEGDDRGHEVEFVSLVKDLSQKAEAW